MSAEINNGRFRQEKLKEIIALLHGGKTVGEVKGIFAEHFEGVSAEDISKAEQALILEGMPVSEIQRLCDVHAAVFKGSIEEIHRRESGTGHPAEVLKAENRAIESLVETLRGLTAETGDPARLIGRAAGLSGLDIHYKKKENLLFPYMEKYGVTGPPQVMWGVDDEIRAEYKAFMAALGREEGGWREKAEALFTRVTDMIFKEENIMLPILLEHLTDGDWAAVSRDSGQFGFCLIPEPPAWSPEEAAEARALKPQAGPGGITLPTGSFTERELAAALNSMPIDITFADAQDRVRYFSEGRERIFPRTVSVLGRNVSNCHPPASVHIVEKLVEDFRTGRKDSEDFWLHLGERFIYIRYFAVRGPEGEYLGVLEATQDIKPIREITGEKRLMSE